MTIGTATFWIVIAAAGACFGAVFGFLFKEGPTVAGMIFGACVGGVAIAYERGVLFPSYSRRLRLLPTPAYLVAAELSLLLVVLVGMTVTGSLMWTLGLTDKTLLQAATPQPASVLYALAVSALLVSVLRVRELLGSGTFANILLGRYHRPVSEERVFLFLDLVGSTTYAEKHGDLAAQELLKAVFSAIAEPVRRHRGQVDDYIGDQVIISWPLVRGIEQARCVACVFAVRRTLGNDRDWWITRFGVVPELRAALHGGSVVTAEVGVDRHKIAYFGDVMNATSRLEGLCRTTGRPVLISDAVLARMPVLPDGIEAEELGLHSLRGRSGTMVVHSLAEKRKLKIICGAKEHSDAEDQRKGAGLGHAARAGGL
ncbi:adenylate/guanylate cyclase domain-containing protein [Methylobacterium sp. Leaf399]|uniref:adenylate/guanylate cyclase domain-containing protein n=1 Tax=Methylobacterium sp. Leaf399 TaxID=1736364 RepID=UPI0009E93C68|nr:adenylate/guanylate cyclase domain-containing protein [Methylobacterium sp. Leaf399]